MPSASSNFSSDRPPSTLRPLRPPPRSFSTTAGGGTARSVCSHLCPSRSSILPVPCGLTRHRRRQNAPELADGRDASPPPFPPSPVALLLVAAGAAAACAGQMMACDVGRAGALWQGMQEGGRKASGRPRRAPRDRGGQDDRARRGRAVAQIL